MTQQLKQETKTQGQPAVSNWAFPALPDKFTQQVPVSSKKSSPKKVNEKQYE